jgi:hypothetical protein
MRARSLEDVVAGWAGFAGLSIEKAIAAIEEAARAIRRK